MLGDQLCARARGQRPNVFLLYHTSSLKNLAVAVYWRGPQLGLSCEHLSMDFSGGLDFLIIWRLGFKEPASRTSWTDPQHQPCPRHSPSWPQRKGAWSSFLSGRDVNTAIGRACRTEALWPTWKHNLPHLWKPNRPLPFKVQAKCHVFLLTGPHFYRPNQEWSLSAKALVASLY